MCFTNKKTDPSYIKKGKTKPEGKKNKETAQYRYTDMHFI